MSGQRRLCAVCQWLVRRPVEHKTPSSVRLQRSRTVCRRASPPRELWFAAHGRALPEEMTTLSQDLQDAVHRTERPAPALDALLSPAPIGRTPCGACGHDRRGCR